MALARRVQLNGGAGVRSRSGIVTKISNESTSAGKLLAQERRQKKIKPGPKPGQVEPEINLEALGVGLAEESEEIAEAEGDLVGDDVGLVDAGELLGTLDRHAPVAQFINESIR